MAANTVRGWKTLFLMGAFLTVLGSFLPWKCYGDIVWYCSAGLDFNLDALALINPSAAMMTVTALVAAVLIVSAVDSIQRWRIEIRAIVFASALLYFLIDKNIVTDNGGLAVIILCGSALWCFFRVVEFAWRSDLVIKASTLLLAGVSTYQVITVLLKQIVEGYIVGGTSLQFGLQIVFIGSSLMLVALLWEHHSRYRHLRQEQMGKL